MNWCFLSCGADSRCFHRASHRVVFQGPGGGKGAVNRSHFPMPLQVAFTRRRLRSGEKARASLPLLLEGWCRTVRTTCLTHRERANIFFNRKPGHLAHFQRGPVRCAAGRHEATSHPGKDFSNYSPAEEWLKTSQPVIRLVRNALYPAVKVPLFTCVLFYIFQTGHSVVIMVQVAHM